MSDVVDGKDVGTYRNRKVGLIPCENRYLPDCAKEVAPKLRWNGEGAAEQIFALMLEGFTYQSICR